MHVCAHAFVKEVTHLIVGDGKSEICKTGWQARDSERSCSVESEGNLEVEFLLLWGTSVFSFKAFN